MKLELLHLEDMFGRKVVRLCIILEASGNDDGITVLSSSNPMS